MSFLQLFPLHFPRAWQRLRPTIVYGKHILHQPTLVEEELSMRPHAGKGFVARPFVAAYSNNFIRLPSSLGKDISSEVRGEACEEEELCGEGLGK